MGNCMVVEEKVVKVMRPDGKILEYSSPTMVQQVLSDFPGQLVCDYSSSLQQQQQHQQQSLLPEAKLVGGRLYCLVPLPQPSTPASAQQVVVKKKKKVRFAVPEGEKEKESDQNKKVDDDAPGKTGGGGVVRIKLVITKQELEELLNKGGVSVSGMVSHLQDQQRLVKVDVGDGEEDQQHHQQQQQQEEEEWQRSWKPVLESIPEVA